MKYMTQEEREKFGRNLQFACYAAFVVVALEIISGTLNYVWRRDLRRELKTLDVRITKIEQHR